MSSNSVIIETPPSTNGQLSSTTNKLNDLYSTYKTHSSSPNLSRSSSSSSSTNSSSSSLSPKNPTNSSRHKINSNSSHHRKESTLKLPYPVLSDHRDPSSILLLLQKETQTTSKKISDVIQQISDCEERLTLSIATDNEKKTLKYERVKFKQQLDGLKKHERRVNLQIDFMTTKTEIKGLEDEQNSDESQQIKILLGKLKQKLEKMKIYMRTRNEQMKKISNGRQRLNNTNDNRKSSSQKQSNTSSGKDFNRKRSSTSLNNSHLNKRLKPPAALVRLTSRITNHDSKKHTIQPPIVRFINKTTNAKINFASPTTPASSSSTLSSPLIATSSISTSNNMTNSFKQNEIPSIDDDDDDDDDELDLELNIDELFNDDSYSEQAIQRIKAGMNELTSQTKS